MAFPKYLNNQKFCGTYRYSFRHALNYKRTSRRDDIESIFNTLIFLFKGELTWSKFSKDLTGKEKIKNIKHCMLNFDKKPLFEGLPDVFQFIHKNISFLEFEEKPPYEFFMTLVEKEKIKLLRKKWIKQKYKFIWTEIIN